MRGDVIEIRARGNILLIGGAGTFAGLPATLRQRSVGVSAVQHLDGDTQALQGLRHFWLRRSHPGSIAAASDHDLLSLVAANVAHGDLDVVVLPSHHARGHAVVPSPGAPGPPPARIASARSIVVDRATRGATAPGHARPSPTPVPPAPRLVGRMGLEERLSEVLRRAAARLPRAMGDELLSLVTPESIAAALGLAALGAAANLMPFGWAADVILAAIAFGFGGLAAVHALGDLVTCFKRIADAESERDLDEAAEALARAASAITVAGLAAILHEKARRWGGGGEGSVEATSTGPAPKARPARVSEKHGSSGAGGARATENAGLVKPPIDRVLLDRIRKTRKGERPDPRTYIPADVYEAHLAKFDGGASRFIRKSALEKYGPGQSDGTAFVMPRSEADAILAKAGGDKRAMEKALGFPENSLESDELVQVNFDDPGALGLRIPSGNEAGANDLWMPGGRLPTGLSEAVIDVPRTMRPMSKYER